MDLGTGTGKVHVKTQQQVKPENSLFVDSTKGGEVSGTIFMTSKTTVVNQQL